MTGIGTETLRELLEQSLLAWRLVGTVQCTGDDKVSLSCNATGIGIERVASGSPFRWMVTVNGRRRGAISLVAVLRQVRAALDPGYETHKIRVAPQPVMPS